MRTYVALLATLLYLIVVCNYFQQAALTCEVAALTTKPKKTEVHLRDKERNNDASNTSHNTYLQAFVGNSMCTW